MPSFEDVTPTVLQSPVPRETPAEKRHVKKKKKGTKVRETTSALLLSGSAHVFLKVCGWCPRSPLSVSVTGQCEENG